MLHFTLLRDREMSRVECFQAGPLVVSVNVCRREGKAFRIGPRKVKSRRNGIWVSTQYLYPDI
jgi:hypothetical protein